MRFVAAILAFLAITPTAFGQTECARRADVTYYEIDTAAEKQLRSQLELFKAGIHTASRIVCAGDVQISLFGGIVLNTTREPDGLDGLRGDDTAQILIWQRYLYTEIPLHLVSVRQIYLQKFDRDEIPTLGVLQYCRVRSLIGLARAGTPFRGTLSEDLRCTGEALSLTSARLERFQKMIPRRSAPLSR